MRTTRAAVARPALLAVLALAGSFLLTPYVADARPTPLVRESSGGPAAAAGQASVVSGSHVVPFGTEPLFRSHPKGEFSQVGRALITMAQASSG